MRFLKAGVFAAGLICLTLCSCSQKKVILSEKSTEAQELIFQQARYHKTGIAENTKITKIYYPPALDKFLFRHWLENGENLYLIEKYYPECKGIIDSDSFYSVACDSADWVENAVDSVEEERLGSEIIDLLENEMEIQPPVDFEQLQKEFDEIQESEEKAETENSGIPEVSEAEKLEKNGENADGAENSSEENTEVKNVNPEPVEKRVLDSMNRLKFMEYDTEILVNQTRKNGSVIIHRNGNKVVRLFYDNLCRLVKKEIWNIPDFANAKLLSKEELTYSAEEGKITFRQIEEDSKIMDYSYDEAGRGNSVKIYEKYGEEKLLLSNSSWKYNKDGNITEEENITNQYNEGKLTDSSSKKECFVYSRNKETGKSELSSYEYYENGVLKIKTDYNGDKDTYTTKVDFDDTYSVISYYEKGKKVKDVYTTGGIVRRTRVYE